MNWIDFTMHGAMINKKKKIINYLTEDYAKNPLHEIKYIVYIPYLITTREFFASFIM